jgi:integrase
VGAPFRSRLARVRYSQRGLRAFPTQSRRYVFPRHSIRMLQGGNLAVICNVELSEPVRSWQRVWRKVLKNAKLHYRWHDLRHTFMTLLAENPNVSEETIRALAGHVSKEMLTRYSHIRVKRSAKRSRLLSGIGPKIRREGAQKWAQFQRVVEGQNRKLPKMIWLPPRDSNPDNLLQRQVS